MNSQMTTGVGYRSAQGTSARGGSGRVGGLTLLAAAAGSVVGLTVGSAGAQDGWHYEAGQPGLTFPVVGFREVDALTEWTSNGTTYLVAAGLFNKAGGGNASCIAKWNGSAWSAFGTNPGFNAKINALAVYNGDLYAGGEFTTIGTAAIRGIAKWDATANLWRDVGTGSTTGGPGITSTSGAARIQALTVFDEDGSGPIQPALYAGGEFDHVNLVVATRLAKWNNTAWTSIGAGPNGTVYALAGYTPSGGSPALYAGGTFNLWNGGAAPHIMKWQAGTWQQVSFGLDNNVYALATHNDGSGLKLYAGGLFQQPLGVGLGRMMRIGAWNGTAWSKLTGAVDSGADGPVYALGSFTDSPLPASKSLYIGGSFTNVGDVTSAGTQTAANRIARWHAGIINPLRAGAGSSVVYAIGPREGTDRGVYIGGKFDVVDGKLASGIAKWTLADCNLNGQDDVIDIATGSSFDCNRDGVPDECEVACRPTQAILFQGPDCGGHPAKFAWQQQITLSRAWFTRDGDPLWGKGEGRIQWENRPEHSRTIVDQYPYGHVNLGQLELKIKRNPKRNRKCTGKHTYRWNDINTVIYDDAGPNELDLVNNVAETRPNLNITVYEQDRRFGQVAYRAVRLALKALDDAISVPFDIILGVPVTWSNTRIAAANLKTAWHAINERVIADLHCGGIATNQLPTTNSIPCAEQGNNSPFPICEGNGQDNTVNYLFTNTLGWPNEKYAMGQYHFTTRKGSQTGYLGQQIVDGQNDAVGRLNGGDELLRYEFFQRSGSELALRAIFAGSAECDKAWPGMGANDRRIIHFYFDIDTNIATGVTAPATARGAEYEVRVTQRRIGMSGDLESTVEIINRCPTEGILPVVRFEPLQDRIEVGIDPASIGLCPTGRPFSSWVVVERTTSSGSVITDTCPNSPNLPQNRYCMGIQTDAECPKLLSVVQEVDASDDVASIRLIFSERVKPLTPADVEVKRGNSSVPVVVTMLNNNTSARLTRGNGAAFSSGKHTVRVLDSVTDVAGNRLDGDGDDICGGDALRRFCNHKMHGYGKRATGEVTGDFVEGEAIFFEGTDLTPNRDVCIYVTRAASIETAGALLIDQTSNGVDHAATSSTGTLGTFLLGSVTQRGEYYFVIDTNCNGVWDPDVDIACSECGVSLTVGDECQNPVEDLLAMWSFDEATAQAGSAETVGGLDGIFIGHPQPVALATGGHALRFNAGDSMVVANHEDINLDDESFSIEFWINRASATGQIVVLDKSDPLGGPTGNLPGVFYVASQDENVNMVMCSGGPLGSCWPFPSTGNAVTANTWHHVAFVGDHTAGTMEIFIDGTSNATYALPLIDVGNPYPLQVIKPAGAAFIGCMLDELAMYGTALPAETIQSIANTHSHCLPEGNPCPADFNNDGGIDGADIYDFFNAFGNGDFRADVNYDGGVDGGDVEAFFAVFQAGGC